MAALEEQRDDELILVVDDDPGGRRLLAKILDRNGYPCITAGNIAEARERMQEEKFALVLTDMDMPGGSGLDLLMSVGAAPDVATVLVTGIDDPNIAKTAMEMGAYGYIIKPYVLNEILINVASALRRRRLEIENRNHRTRLEQMVRDRTQEVLGYVGQLEEAEREMKVLQRETIQRLSMAAEFRDDDTPRHVQRVTRYCALIAERIGEDPERCEMIGAAGAMHDVGKIGIPDSILMKPGRLTDPEWEIMKGHCEIGHRLLSGTSAELLNTAATVALTHHERVDGSGYPQGLKGEDIPLEGRITAIADVFDALTSHRVYSRAVTSGKAIEMLRSGRGTQFDEVLLDVFLGAQGVVLGIKERLADPVPESVDGEMEEDPRRIP
ncbi:MAG TPA: HD domain-containing phosphohydrolase [Actinomycetota bacterium]|nr:HD domain-containing phosphohydrolase [Actinomycetota bacterium]